MYDISNAMKFSQSQHSLMDPPPPFLITSESSVDKMELELRNTALAFIISCRRGETAPR